MKKALTFNMLVLFAFIFLMTGCGVKEQSSLYEEQKKKAEFNLRLGHVGPTDPYHPWEKYALSYAIKLNGNTNGKVFIETFPESELGGDADMVEALIEGTLDIGLISTITMGNFVPQLQVWDLPYIFPTDNQKVDAILEGEIGARLATYAEEKGLVILAYWENDWRMMSNSKHPIRNIEDLEGLKMRVVQNKPSIDWFGTRAKATAVPMAFNEVYEGLKQKKIDGQDNGTILTFGSEFYDVQPYFTTTKHIYAPLAFVVSKKTWDTFSTDIQEQMKELAITIGKEQRAYNRLVAFTYLEQMKNKGVEVTNLSTQSLRGFQQSAQETYRALGSEIGQDLIDMMLKAGRN